MSTAVITSGLRNDRASRKAITGVWQGRLAIALLVLLLLASWLFVAPPAAQGAGNPYPWGQCTWGAWGLWQEHYGWTPPVLWGDAHTWNEDAKSKGLYTGTVPRAFSWVVFERGAAGAGATTGHVAFVTKVHSAEDFRVRETNAPVLGAYSERDVTMEAGISFIYPFTDTATSPYREAIYALLGGEIISGYSNNTFRPREAVKRAQFAKMVVLTL
ncbi:MAG: CHAP domain-containing protein, partial [Thermoleophilia bacterium]